jgi:hypothetical protein
VGFNDLINNSNNIADLIFQETNPSILELMLKYTVPDLPWKDKWSFAISSKAYAKLNFIDIDPKLGEA